MNKIMGLALIIYGIHQYVSDRKRYRERLKRQQSEEDKWDGMMTQMKYYGIKQKLEKEN